MSIKYYIWKWALDQKDASNSFGSYIFKNEDGNWYDRYACEDRWQLIAAARSGFDSCVNNGKLVEIPEKQVFIELL